MSIRLTEEQLKKIQNRIKGSKVARQEQGGSSINYDLQAAIVMALEWGVSSPSSPLLITLHHGLKELSQAKSRNRPFERIEQAIALLWLEVNAPEAFSMTTATPMGGYRPKGAGAQMKGEGAKAGYPDLLMDKPMGGYHGLRVEMKKYSSSAKASEVQNGWLTRLSGQGYASVLCRGHQSAIQVFSSYLNLPPPEWVKNIPDWCIEKY